MATDDVRCPQWKTFLYRIMGGAEDLVRYLQRAAGYTLTGSTRERVAFFAYGPGANGKTVYGQAFKVGAVVWRSDFGVMTLTEWLRINGVVTDGWRLNSITGVSDDGIVIAGGGVNPEGENCYWVARIQG